MNIVAIQSINSLNWTLPNFFYQASVPGCMKSVFINQQGAYTNSTVDVFVSVNGVNYFLHKTVPSIVFNPNSNPNGGIFIDSLPQSINFVRIYPSNLALWNMFVCEYFNPILLSGK